MYVLILQKNYWINFSYNLKKHQEALEFYEKALDIEPNNPAMLTNKGVCLNNLKMYDEALVIKMKI